ncbi:MAG: hypothetical protein M3273_03135 [Actinomycetota bacterium]|nr:hypothetical protein [Actinomycetota bacterium]
MTPDERRLEDALRAVGDEYLRRNPANLPAARERLQRLRRRRQLRMGAMGAVAGAAVAALGLYVWPSAVEPDGRARPAAPDGAVRGTVEIAVGDAPGEMAVSEDAIWVSNGGSGTISRIDPVTDRVVQTIEVDGSPGDLAVGGRGELWIANPELGVVQVIDTATNAQAPDLQVDVADPGQSLDLAIDEYLWVSVVEEALVQVNPVTGAIVRSDEAVAPVNVAARNGRVFVLEEDGHVLEVDAGTGLPTGFEIDLPVEGRGDVHLHGGRLWVAEGDGSEILSADAADALAPTETYDFRGSYVEMALVESRLVVLSELEGGGGVVSLFVPGDGEPLTEYDLVETPSDLVRDESGLWVSNGDAGTVARLPVAISEG